MRKVSSKKGFTLVELLVVIAISAIILGAAVLGIIGYTDYANFKRQNEYAQTLFVGAQTALTKYSENGELESIRKTVEKYGNLLTADNLEGDAKTKFQSEYEGRVYTITVNKDGAQVPNRGVGDAEKQVASDALRAVFDKIMSPYVYDKAILENASVTLEFDPTGGTIYSVLYSDKQDGFVYGEAQGKHVSISHREEAARKKIMLGYYGVDTLADETSRYKERVAIDQVMLVNENTLELQFMLSEKYKSTATSELTYNLELKTAKDQKLMSTTVSEVKSLYRTPSEKHKYEDLYQELEVVTYKADGSANAPQKMKFIVYGDEDYRVHLVLDAIDFSAVLGSNSASNLQTNTLHRLGIDAEIPVGEDRDVYMTVRAEGAKFKPSAIKRSNTENMYFGDEATTASGAKFTKDYDIENMRHLFNIRFMEDEMASNKTMPYAKLSYNQTKTMSWKDVFTGTVESEVFNAQVEVPVVGENDIKTAFPSLPTLGKTNVFSGGETYQIQDLVLRQTTTALGLFSTNLGTITDATLANVEVEGGSAVGSFCGINSGTVKNLTTIGGTVLGSTDVGGIVGRDGTSSMGTVSVKYQGLTNDCDVKGFRYVGGIIGRLEIELDPKLGEAGGPTKSRNVDILDCVNTGLIQGDVYKPTNPTQGMQDDINDVLTGKTVNTSANRKDAYNNMFKMFLEQNGGRYPNLNAYDRETFLYTLYEVATRGIQNHTNLSKEAAVDWFAAEYVWVPCAVRDPNGSVYSTEVDSGKTPMSIVLLAKSKAGAAGSQAGTLESFNRGAFAYYNGKYYYHAFDSEKPEDLLLINDGSLTNNSDSITRLTVYDKAINWIEIDYTPTGFGYTPGTKTSETTAARAALVDDTAPVMPLAVNSPEVDKDHAVTTLKNEPSYIGGIVGYANNSLPGKTGKFTIMNCSNNQDTSIENITKLLEADRRFTEENPAEPRPENRPLLGAYVGGIAGYAKNIDFTNANSTGGYVIGSNYVGGITGYNEYNEYHSPLKNLSSKASVLGRVYVGGITGANTTNSKVDTNGFIIPEKEYSKAAAVDSCSSYGSVITTIAYGGGITGLNAGNITDCHYDSIRNSDHEAFMEKFNGDYIGGVIGLNYGNLTATAEKINNYVAGKNFIGGIIGFNAADNAKKISGYHYAGGTVVGKNFVGGFAGANTSTTLVSASAQNIGASPNAVKGDYFIGGIVGGNLPAASSDFTAGFTLNNQLGKILGKAFVGGQVGFHITGAKPEAMQYLATTLAAQLEEISKGTGDTTLKALEATNNIITNLRNQKQPDSDFTPDDFKSTYRMTLDGTGKGNNQNRLDLVSGEIYVGGVIGYNDKDTKLTISNVLSKTSVTSTRAVVQGELSGSYNRDPYKDNTEKTYSYTGGIVGKCTPEMVIDSCALTSTATVKTNGTYSGGLVEINEGEIRNCAAVNIGSNGQNYVGGLVGVNKSTGKILGCKMNSVTVTGKNMVGGLVSENFGTVDGQNTVLTGKVNGYGIYIGGITGANRGVADTNVKNYTLDISVSGSGTSVGGAVGLNEALVEALSYKAGSNNTVTGKSTVGGIIGAQTSGSGMNLSSNADVTAEYGLAGGIAGLVSSGKLDDTVNSGRVLVQSEKNGEEAYAGGITARVAGGALIDHSRNNGDIIGARAGGLVGDNKGTVMGDEDSSGVAKFSGGTVTGKILSGGIAAINRSSGQVFSASFAGTVTNDVDSYGSSLGGIVGRNLGNIHAPQVADSTILSKASGVSMGGIAGESSDRVTGVPAKYVSVKNTTVKFVGYNLNYFGNVGGVAGTNTGVIKNCTIQGSEIMGSANDPQNPPQYAPGSNTESNGSTVYGYGGIVGVNGSSAQNGEAGTVENCLVRGSTVRAIGGPGNIANLGGIAGVNEQGSTVQRCNFSSSSATEVTTVIATSNAASTSYSGATSDAAYAHIGGAVGYNLGTVNAIGKQREKGYGDGTNTASETARKLSADNSSIVRVYASQGQVGGIVGYNKSTGLVSNSATGSKWTVSAHNHAKNNSIGGVIGYNISERSVSGCDNWAKVSKDIADSDSTGGVIGRQEVFSRNGWSVKDCVNYGQISGATVGGVIGTIKNRGGIVEKCDNYGSVTNLNTTGDAGGIVGRVYVISDGEQFNVTGCKNFGHIASPLSGDPTAGGVIGRLGYERTASEDKRPSYVVSNCINTGIIEGYGYKAGIIAHSDMEGYGLIMANCNNYGFPVNWKNNKQDFSGVIGYKVGALRIRQSYGVAGWDASNRKIENPVTYNSNVTESDNRNYYFVTKDGDKNSSDLGVPVTLKRIGTTNTYRASGYSDLNFGVPYTDFMADTTDTLSVLGGSNNKRQQVYLNINSNLVRSDSKPNAPSLKTEYFYVQGEAIRIEWWNTAGCSAKITAKYADGTTEVIETADPRWEFSTKGRDGQNITFTCVAVSPSGIESNPTTVTLRAKNTPPIPEVRFVLDNTTSPNCYKILIDNAADYKDIPGTTTVSITPNGTGGSSYRVNIVNGVYTPPTVAGDGAARTYSVVATPDNATDRYTNYGLSRTAVLNTLIPTRDQYMGNALASIVNKNVSNLTLGFAGDTPETLSYTLGLKMNSSDKNLFYRTEFLATDNGVDGLGVPVVYSTGDILVSGAYVNATTDNYAPMKLVNLPQDLNETLGDGITPKYDDVLVRSYPISAENDMVYTGVTVGDKNFTAQELRSLNVTENGALGGSTKLIGGTTENPILKTGYVITKKGEDSYQLSYNVLLKNSTIKQVTNFKDVTVGIPVAEQPEIVAELDEDSRTYRAEWDVNGTAAKYPGAAYSYRLVGTTKTEDEVEILTGTVDSAGEGTNIISEDVSHWNYVKVKLTVSRRGTVNTDGNTTLFPSSSSKEIFTRIPLSQVPVPEVKLRDKNNLIYDVRWSGMPTLQEQDALERYEIIVQTTAAGPDYTPVEITSVIPVADKTALNGEIDFSKLTWKDQNGNEVTGAAIGDKEAKISVRAIAQAGDMYTNSPEGVEYSFTLPIRLKTPLQPYFQFGAKKPDEAMSIANFEDNGFTLSYEHTESDDKAVVGKYELTVDVVSKAGEDAERKPLYDENDPLVMDGTLLGSKATATLNKLSGLLAEYSNYDLIMKIRAVSDSEISSEWFSLSRESLPKVTVDAIRVADSMGKTGTKVPLYLDDGQPEGNKVDIQQDSFTWSQTRFTKGYTIDMERLAEILPDKTHPVDRLQVTIPEGKLVPEVYFLNSDNKDETSEQGQLMAASGTRVEGQKTTYTYNLYNRRIPLLKEGDIASGYNAELTCQLTVVVTTGADGKVKTVDYLLVLPDSKTPKFSNLEGSIEQDAYSIRTVTFQSLSEDTNRFDDSVVVMAQRDDQDKDILKPVTDQEVLQKTLEAMKKALDAQKAEIAKRTLKITDVIVTRPFVPPVIGPTVTPKPSASPSPSPSPSPAPSPTPGPSVTPTPAPSETPGPTSKPTPSPTPDVTPSPTPSQTPDVTPSPEPTPEPTEQPTPPPTEQPTPEPPPVPTPEPTQEPTPEPTQAPASQPESQAGEPGQ